MTVDAIKTTLPHAIIIIGPTASGKTDLSYQLACLLDGEIINADVGQFYTPLTIGTAKPDWKNNPIKAHLFDIIDTPQDFTVHEYRKTVLNSVTTLCKSYKTPIIVGGSSFYIKSLLFPTQQLPSTSKPKEDFEKFIGSIPDDQLWPYLHALDIQRAQKIHPHDFYRIKRALFIWFTTGQKPSNFKPLFDPPFPFFLIVIAPSKKEIDAKIRIRTDVMLDAGWLEEAKNLMYTPWETFINKKGLIGYSEIFFWLQKNNSTIEELSHAIQKNTIDYAKRQVTFIKGLTKQLIDNQVAAKQPFDMYYAQDIIKEVTCMHKKFQKFKQNFLVGKN